MKSKRFLFTLLSLFALASLVLSACGSQPSQSDITTACNGQIPGTSVNVGSGTNTANVTCDGSTWTAPDWAVAAMSVENHPDYININGHDVSYDVIMSHTATTATATPEFTATAAATNTPALSATNGAPSATPESLATVAPLTINNNIQILIVSAASLDVNGPTGNVESVSCDGVNNVSEPHKFSHVVNHDFGDPFNYWLIFAWDGTNPQTWVGAVGEPMESLDLERATMEGVEYLVKAESEDAVTCLAHQIADQMSITPYWLYVGKHDTTLPTGFSTEFPGHGWTMEVRPYIAEPIADGNNWTVNGEQFSTTQENRTFGEKSAWTLVQSWDITVGPDPAQHVLVAPGYQAFFSTDYEGSIFKTEITVSQRKYFERILQMVAEVVFRDHQIEVLTSYCGPLLGDRPDSWWDFLPDGVTCEKMP
jgi:hypothetical protein